MVAQTTYENLGIQESVANVSQIITLDKQFLAEQIGQLNTLTMQQIDDGIKLVLNV